MYALHVSHSPSRSSSHGAICAFLECCPLRSSQTYIGNVLISVNPFRDLGIYGQETLSSYRGKNRLEMSPHVFAIAESAYYNMQAYKENQCVIITGESGAGKTEAAKRIMQYIAAVSTEGARDIQDIKEMVLATNPLLESFGCAKTLRNNNSSRHVSGQTMPSASVPSPSLA